MGEEGLWVKEREEAARGRVKAERKGEAEKRLKVRENSLDGGLGKLRLAFAGRKGQEVYEALEEQCDKGYVGAMESSGQGAKGMASIDYVSEVSLVTIGVRVTAKRVDPNVHLDWLT